MIGFDAIENGVEDEETAARAEVLRRAHAAGIATRTDRLFAGLLLAQWAVIVGLSLLLSPRDVASGRVHPHVWYALLLGALIAVPAAALGMRRSGEAGKRVLVVDDNAKSRRIAREYLRDTNAAITEATDGHEALTALSRAIAANEPFDVVLMDYAMPNLDGGQTLAAMRSDPQLKAVPVVLLTSTDAGSRSDLQQQGFAEVLVKPVWRRQLLRALGTTLAQPASAVARPRATPAKPTVDLGLRVLVADDMLVNQKLLVHMLARLGCRADAVANGLEAVEALKAATYDCVLMDCQMPEMDGYEASTAIRKGDAGADAAGIPIIATTASAYEADRTLCLQAGMTDFVSKPIRPEELLAALRTLVRIAA